PAEPLRIEACLYREAQRVLQGGQGAHVARREGAREGLPRPALAWSQRVDQIHDLASDADAVRGERAPILLAELAELRLDSRRRKRAQVLLELVAQAAGRRGPGRVGLLAQWPDDLLHQISRPREQPAREAQLLTCADPLQRQLDL